MLVRVRICSLNPFAFVAFGNRQQGTLFLLLREYKRPLEDAELNAKFSEFGDVKSIRRYKDQPKCVLVGRLLI